MAVINPPLWLQAGAYTARQDRRLISSLVREGGVAGSTQMLVTQRAAGANMSVDVSEGRAFIWGTEAASTQGAYHVETQGVTNVVLAAAHATLARYDLIVARVRDAEYSGATNAWALEVVAGTPAGSPAEPTVPANSIVLARVTVAAAVTSILNAVILDRRPRAKILGGVTVATTTTLPSLLASSHGDMAYATDTDTLYVLTATAWTPQGPPVYLRAGSAWTAIASPAYNAVTGASLTLPPGKWLVQGLMAFGVLTAGNRYVNLRLRNVTAGTDLDIRTIGHGPGFDSKPTPTVVGTANLAASATIRLEASVDVLDGTQNFQGAKIWAVPASALL